MKHKAKPSGSSGGSRLRLAILAATVAAFLLVPVAQAAATTGTMTVRIAGTGSGEVTSTNLGGAHPPIHLGEPDIGCSYVSPGPQTGQCENEMVGVGALGFPYSILFAYPAPGSEIGSWTIEKGEDYYGVEAGEFCNDAAYKAEGVAEYGGPYCHVRSNSSLGEEAEVVVTFCTEGSGGECSAPPTPKFALTVTPEGTGSGTVVSNPAGIECGGTCSAEFEENTEVTLTASPAAGSTFTSWKKCDTGKVEGRKCTVKMSLAKTVGAKFSPTQNLALSKSGPGTVSGGATCDANCAAITVAIAKGKATTLTAKVAKEGSEFKEWTGACAGEGLVCPLTMSGDKTTEAVFTAIEKVKLTVNKTGGGVGTVKSSPTSINCGTSCSTSASLFYKGKEVVLTASVQAGKGSALGTWSGGGCAGTEATPCTVSMSEAKTVTAEFK